MPSTPAVRQTPLGPVPAVHPAQGAGAQQQAGGAQGGAAQPPAAPVSHGTLEETGRP
jgi:hypothetical protein